MPKVSVIVPNFNYAQFLPERMASIFEQTFQDFEVILLDDCSTDNSRELLTEYAQHDKVSHCIFNDKNSGSPFHQWVKGIELAKGDWIWIAEADDVADTHFLEYTISEVEKYSSVGLCYSHLKAINVEGIFLWTQEIAPNRLFSGEQFIHEKLIYSTTIFNVSCCVFSRKSYDLIDVSIFQKYPHAGDYMFYIQMAEVADVFELGLVLDGFRIHQASTSHSVNIDTKLEETFSVLEYLVSRHRINQMTYAMTYARHEYNNHYSPKDLKKVLKAYFQKGNWLVPICFYTICCYNRTYPFWHLFTRIYNYVKRNLF